MARAVVAPVLTNTKGSAVAFAAPTVDGDAVQPNSIVLVQNITSGATAASVTVTLVTGATQGGFDVADATVVVPAGQTLAIGPFGPVFPQPAGPTRGLVHLDYSAPASVTRAVVAPGY